MKNIPRSQIVSLIFLLLLLIILPVVLNSNQQQKQFLSKAEEISVISPTPSSTITQSSVLPNDIELDIPDYLPEYLRYPNKLFSGRTIRVIGQFDNPTIILSSTKITKQLTIKKNTTEYITIELPVELETNTYNLDIRDGETTKNVTLPIEGLTQEEKQLSNNQAPQYNRQIDHSAIVGRNTIPCCYWEMVMGGDPENKDHLVLTGRSSTRIVRTTDGFDSYDISFLPDNYLGDPKLLMLGNDLFYLSGMMIKNTPKVERQFVITGILMNGSILHNNLTSHLVKDVPEDINPNNYILVDYPKIAYDSTSNSIFISNNAVLEHLKDNEGVKLPIYISHNGGESFIQNSYIIPNRYKSVSPIKSMDVGVGENPFLYTVYEIETYTENPTIKLMRFDAHDLSNYQIFDAPDKMYAPPRTSFGSFKAFMDSGSVVKVDKSDEEHRGRIYLLWASPTSIKEDVDFEYQQYGFNFDVFLSFSDDDGVTWHNRIKINDDATEGDQLFPSMAIDEKGIVHIAFLDHRDNQYMPQFDVYYAKTDGQTVSKNIKINERPTPNTLGGTSIGDYADMVVAYTNLVYVGFPCIKQEEIGKEITPTIVCVTKIDPNKIDTVQSIEGDLNGDGKVDIFDLVTVAKDFGKRGGDFPGDADKNGVVDIFDLVIVAKNFGKKL